MTMSTKASRWCVLLIITVMAVSLQYSSAQNTCEVGDLWATYVTQNKLTVNWNSNPGCVTKYSVCLKVTGGTREQCQTLFNFIIQWTSSSLQACTNYTVTVAALDSEGTRGPNSTITIPTAPEPVTGIDVIERSDDYLIVNWWPSGSTCSKSYTVSWCALLDYGSRCSYVDSANTTVSTTVLKLNNLDACTSYTISVAAVGEKWGSDTTRVTGSTSSIDLTTITGLSVQLREMGKWQLNWNVPSKGLSCFDYYYVCFLMTGDSTIHCGVSYNNSMVSKVQHPCTGFTANVSMHLRAGGYSPNATITFETRPGDATYLEANTTASGISVEWSPSFNNYSCVVSYLVSWCQSAYPEDCDSEHRAVVASSNPNRTHYDITGLEACTQYPVAIEAVSRDGEQSEPATINVRTNVDVAPSAVQNLRTTRVTEDIITVAWQQPSNFKCVASYSACVHQTANASDEVCDSLNAARLGWSTRSALKPSTSYTVVVAPIDYDGYRGANASVSVLA